MRYVADITHPYYKISVYQWNGKFIVKFEAFGFFEQVFKFSEADVPDFESVKKLIDDAFIQGVTTRFETMRADAHHTLMRHDMLF